MVKISIKEILFFLILFSYISYSATYYVATTGNDSATGTSSSPWKTIQKAANTVVAGDTVIVQSGTYNERVTFSAGHGGTSGKMVTFKAEPRRTVTMQGFDTTNANYLRIEGFNITYSGGGSGVNINSNYVEVVDNYFYDVKYNGVAGSGVGKSDNIYIANNKMYHCNKGIVASGKNWTVENNEVERLFDYGNDCDYSRFFGENIIFRKNYFHGTLQSEIGSSHVDGFQTYAVNPGEYAKNITMENNIIVDFHQGLMAAGKNNSHSNITFNRNIFIIKGWSSGAWGICAEGIKNISVVNNVFCGPLIHGVGFRVLSGITTTGVIKNNIFYNAGSNYWAEAGCTMDSGYNLLYTTSGTINASNYPKDLVNIDPKFVDITKDDFHLQSGSPCIDAGDPTFPVPPCGGKRIDIGAYEYGCPDDFGFGGGSGSSADRILVYPNPVDFSKSFNNTVKLSNLNSNSKIKIYNTNGEVVKILTSGYCEGNSRYDGGFIAEWDGTNEKGERVPAGVYFCVAESNDIRRGKIVIIR